MINRPSDEKFVVESSRKNIDEEKSDGVLVGVTDELGEKAKLVANTWYTKLLDADPWKDDHECEVIVDTTHNQS